MKSIKRVVSFLLALLLIISAVPITGYASETSIMGIGYITGTNVWVRSKASTSAAIITNTFKNEAVVVLEEVGDWYHVIYNLEEGYIHCDYLVVTTSESIELGYGRVTGTSVSLRRDAGTSYAQVAEGNTGDEAYIIGVKDGWYRVIFEEDVCYIHSDYLELTEFPYENVASPNEPVFFRGGRSLGVDPSAEALDEITAAAMEAAAAAEAPAPAVTEPESTYTPDEDDISDVTAKDIKYGIGFTVCSGLRLRSSASEDANIITSSYKNEVVVVLDKVDNWYKVIYNLQEGYMHGDYLKVNTAENAELGYGKINVESTVLRSGPDDSYGVSVTTIQGEKVYIIGINNGWYKVIYNDHIGYVRSDYVDLTEIPYENKGSANFPQYFRGGKSLQVEPEEPAPSNTPSKDHEPEEPSDGPDSVEKSESSSSSDSVTGEKIVASAKQHLGVPYLWGGTSPSGFDCSGFVYYVLNCVGIKISRTQSIMYTQGTPISKSELQPGDLVFFQNTYKEGISHVGIYVGGGQFIHSPHSGAVVSYSDLNSSYYTKHYYGAVRVIN